MTERQTNGQVEESKLTSAHNIGTMKKAPESFKTQREAYWYRQGLIDAKKDIHSQMNSSIERYSLEWLDHLPTGGLDKRDD